MILENSWGKVEIRPQGAQVLSYIPAGQADLLWVSPAGLWGEGEPLRGGIPLCAPWFASRFPGKPPHGFVRQKLWSSEGPQILPDGSARGTFHLEHDASTLALWPVPFRFEHEITLGPQLTLVFRAWNLGTVAVPFEIVWHTYFRVEDLAQVKIEGLSGEAYFDKNADRRPGRQQGEVVIDRPLDLLFPHVAGDQVIGERGRRTRIASTAPGAVVWNVGDRDRLVEDLGEGAHRHYVCVERGTLDLSEVTLLPGVPYEVTMTVSCGGS